VEEEFLSKLRVCLAVAVCCLFVGTLSATPIIIDQFTDTQSLSVSGPGANPVSASGSSAAPAALGGNRFVMLTRTAGAGTASININAPSAGVFNQSNDAVADSDSLTLWDGGLDGTINPAGLSVDLTDSGVNSQLHFRANVDLLVGVTAAFRFYSGTLSDYSQVIQTLIGGGADFDYFIPFASMTSVGSGANFTNVGAITMFISGPNRMDLQVDLLETTNDEDVPEPATFGLVGSALAGLALLRRRAA
jgi:hypothetical protein